MIPIHHREHKDPKVHLEQWDHKEDQVHKVYPVLQARRVPLDHKEIEVTTDPLDCQEMVVYKDPVVVMVRKERRVRLEDLDQKDPLVNKEIPETLDHQ